jgi:hypothetical protein
MVKLKPTKVTLPMLYKTYHEYLNVSDDDRIDVGLAVALTRKKKGTTRVWLLIIGPSGDWKSVQLTALSDKGIDHNTFFIRKLTKSTLVSGNPKVKDLAPQLDGKLVLIPEMASILKLDPKEKAAIWAQLRDLFDGIAGGQYGSGKKVDYTGLHITLMMGSTPVIDSQILIHQDLGQRELCFRTNPLDSMKKKTMKKVWENEEKEESMGKVLQEITYGFLKNTEYKTDFKITPEIRTKIENLALFLTYMRAPAEIDSFTGELLSDVTPEEPTRILKQLKILFLALKSLDKDYSDDRAIRVIKKVVMSSSHQKRLKIFEHLMENEVDLSTKKLSNLLRLGYKTILREVNVLWNLDMITKKEVQVKDTGSRNRIVNHWHFNSKSNILQNIKKVILDDKEDNKRGNQNG